jgi:hypothetical protein
MLRVIVAARCMWCGGLHNSLLGSTYPCTGRVRSKYVYLSATDKDAADLSQRTRTLPSQHGIPEPCADTCACGQRYSSTGLESISWLHRLMLHFLQK